MKEKVNRLKKENSEHDLQLFNFTEKEFAAIDFHDDGEEMEYHGKMYDIVRVNHAPGKVTVHCLSDAKETYLKMIAKKQQQQKNLRFKKLAAKIYVSAKGLNPASDNFDDSKHYSCSVSLGQVCSISYDILKPPPQLG